MSKILINCRKREKNKKILKKLKKCVEKELYISIKNVEKKWVEFVKNVHEPGKV